MISLLVRFLLIVGLLSGIIMVLLNYRTQTVADDNPSVTQDFNQLIQKCGDDCEQKIRDLVNQAIATLSAKPTTKAVAETKIVPTSQPQTKVEFINFTNVGLTTRTEWMDVDGTDFSYAASTYGNVKEVRWIPRIKTTQGGEASSRLFDISNGSSVPGSEVSTRNSNFVEVESGVLTLRSGNNTYRVEIKSAAGYEANFEKGKLKIVIVN